MMKYRSVIPLFLLLIVLPGCGHGQEQEKGKVCTDNGRFCFRLPVEHEKEDTLLEHISEVNASLIYLAKLDYAGSNQLLAVSKFVSEDKMSADSVFLITVNSIASFGDTEVEGYSLIDHGTYQASGKTLRYKISNPIMDVFCIMFYFMKDDPTTEMYEIKLTTTIDYVEECMVLSEQIALTVEMK
jgi:hypothetical protein